MLDLNKGRVIGDVKLLVREACAGLTDCLSFHSDGTISARRTYFYRQGRTSETFAARVEAAISEAVRGLDLRAECIEHTDTNRAYPSDSFFLARYRLAPRQGGEKT